MTETPKPGLHQPQARISIIEYVHHESSTGHTVTSDSRFCKPSSDEQPYGPRFSTLGEEWVSIDTGWITDPSILVLHNEEGKGLRVVPTKEQLEEVKEKVIEVAFHVRPDSPRDMYSPAPILVIFQIIPPGESTRLHPLDASHIVWRCRKGTARCKIYAFPK